MKKYIIPITIPYSKENEGLVRKINLNNQEIGDDKSYVRKIIEEHLNKISIDYKEYAVEVVFKGIDTEEKIELIKVAYRQMQAGNIKSIRIITVPTCINKKFLKKLKKYKVKTIELEVPTVNEYILKKIGLNYNIKEVKNASKLIRRKRFKLGHQMMIGLPDSTEADDIKTAEELIKMKPKIISITPVLVEKDTYLAKEYYDRNYKPLTLVQAVETCKELVKIFNNNKIEVIAIGYGELDNDLEKISISKKVIDGPYHTSFRQLIESNLWYDAIVNKIKKLNVKVIQVEVTVNPADVDNVVGYKKENIERLKKIYDVELIVTPNEAIEQGKSKIDITKVSKDFAEI